MGGGRGEKALGEKKISHLKDLMKRALDSLSICSVSSRCCRNCLKDVRMTHMNFSSSTPSWFCRATSLKGEQQD